MDSLEHFLKKTVRKALRHQKAEAKFYKLPAKQRGKILKDFHAKGLYEWEEIGFKKWRRFRNTAVNKLLRAK